MPRVLKGEEDKSEIAISETGMRSEGAEELDMRTLTSIDEPYKSNICVDEGILLPRFCLCMLVRKEETAREY